MIKEVWDYFTTSASIQARQEGYLYTAIALSARARRCQKYWQTHLQNCHQEIEKRIKQYSTHVADEKGSHVAVLGSGLLLETPIDILEKYFNEISLIDIVHTKQVRGEIRSKKNIHLIEMDLNKAHLDEKNLNKNHVNEASSSLRKFDFVISANLLSQLPLHVCQQMLKQKVTQEVVSQKAFELQKKHVQDMHAMASHGLLFSDYKVSLVSENKMDRQIEESLSVDPRLNLKWEKTWDWNLAPSPEVEKNKSVVLTEGIFSW